MRPDKSAAPVKVSCVEGERGTGKTNNCKQAAEFLCWDACTKRGHMDESGSDHIMTECAPKFAW
jgi:hypothetical protein